MTKSLLCAIVEGTARSTGEVFFESLVTHLAAAIGVSYAFVAEFAGTATRVRTLASWGKGEIRPNVEYDLAGTPCEDVVRGGLCHHPLGVQRKFPRDQDLVDLGSRATSASRCSMEREPSSGTWPSMTNGRCRPSPAGFSSSGFSPLAPLLSSKD